MSDKQLLKLSERDIIGPGIWMMLHLLALHSEDFPKLKEAYPDIVEVLRKYFPCEECRNHLVKNTDEFSPEMYSGVKDGFFKWSYMLHHKVNKRLNKETPKYEDAFKYFRNPESCKSCSAGGNQWMMYQ